MQYNKINKKILINLEQIVGENFVFVDESTLLEYGADHTEDLIFPPDVFSEAIYKGTDFSNHETFPNKIIFQ